MEQLVVWEERLKSKGIRCTRQRKLILEILIKAQRPLAAQKIFKRLEGKDKKLRLSTVYRNLNYFQREGMVRSLQFQGKESYFELKGEEHHHHLICINCNQMIPLDCPLHRLESSLEDETGYLILDHQMKMYGLCPKCKKK